MGWVKPVGTKLVKYGPQAQLVWKHVAAPATAAAQRTFAARTARRTALKHADTVIAGAILKVMLEGDIFWVVFSGGTSVTAYPHPPVPLDVLIANANLSKKMTPDQVRAKHVAASKGRRAVDAARTFTQQVRRRDRM
ncbi:MAG: hypothetical protein H0T17_10310 [Propionibacteriales bacterium]|nr:hypothetical protein [Propionibacteriales bacterium]